MKKQLHTCGNRCILNKHRNQCKYGFPFNSQLDQQSKFNKVTLIVGNIIIQDMKIAMLCCTMNHCFFLWGAHLNIQCIISSYWSYYLFKYTMKCEPYGALNLNN
jgi:hypothetical protein